MTDRAAPTAGAVVLVVSTAGPDAPPGPPDRRGSVRSSAAVPETPADVSRQAAADAERAGDHRRRLLQRMAKRYRRL